MRYRDHSLHSVFQPIFSLCHRRPVGFEALLRSHDIDGCPVSPRTLLDLAGQRNELRQLDNLCQTLHIDAFAQQRTAPRWLFLNLEPNTITRRWYDDGTLLHSLADAGVAPHEVVIEILEGQIENEPALMDAITFFRNAGALVALDDFGTGHSNFERIWRLAPDIIKLDRGLIVEAEQHRSSRLRRILLNLVSLMHEAGSLVVCEGIETEAQARVALEADVDFVQGFYFAQPRPRIGPVESGARKRLLALTGQPAGDGMESSDAARLAPYADAFRDMLALLQAEVPIGSAVEPLLGLSRTARIYRLDAGGQEIDHCVGPCMPKAGRGRSAPIADSQGGIWYRRRYFRAARAEPGRLQFSRPYLSSTGGYMCVTLSIAVEAGSTEVVCCDVAW